MTTSGISSYTLHVWSNSACTTRAKSDITASTTATSYTFNVSGLTGSKTYYVTFTVKDTAGNTATLGQSYKKSVTTLATPVTILSSSLFDNWYFSDNYQDEIPLTASHYYSGKGWYIPGAYDFGSELTYKGSGTPPSSIRVHVTYSTSKESALVYGGTGLWIFTGTFPSTSTYIHWDETLAKATFYDRPNTRKYLVRSTEYVTVQQLPTGGSELVVREVGAFAT